MSIESPANRTVNWTDGPIGAGVAGSVVALELSPANEVIRFGSMGAAVASGMDAESVAAIGAVTSMLLEGSAAVITADFLASKGGANVVSKINDATQRVGIKKLPTTNPIISLGISSIAGASISTAYEHMQDPNRTRTQNRKYGVGQAAFISAMTAAEGWAIAKGIEHPSPLSLGLGALAVGTAVGAFKFAKKNLVERTADRSNAVLTPQRLGLSPEDERMAMADNRTVMMNIDGTDRPVLVPIDNLEWFNSQHLIERFGTESIYYYTHAAENDEVFESLKGKILELTDKGAVIIYDTVTAKGTVNGATEISEIRYSSDNKLAIEKLTAQGDEKKLGQYTGVMNLKGHKRESFNAAPDICTVYNEAVASGEIEDGSVNGPSVLSVANDEEAEKLWSIYKRPFEKLSSGHPINAGFSELAFKGLMKDPDTVKVVNRSEGELTSLALFVTDLGHCPWLDEKYFTENYPRAVETGNMFVFLGIVTDENHRGASHSLTLIKLLSKLQARRKSSAIISFECGDISAKYIPRAVRYGIWRSGYASISGTKKPKSELSYYALRNA